jgi:hypothetical protein
LNENLNESENVYVLEALTLAGGKAWGCDWSTNDLISAQSGVIRRWQNTIGSFDVIAIDEPNLLLVSDYWALHVGRKARFFSARIEGSQVVPLDELDLFLPSGQRLIDLEPNSAGRRPFDMIGRDETLNVFAENSWYNLDVNGLNDSR